MNRQPQPGPALWEKGPWQLWDSHGPFVEFRFFRAKWGLLFQGNRLFTAITKVLCRQVIPLQQRVGRTGFAEPVLDAAAKNRNRVFFANHLRNRSAQATQDVMLLRGHEGTGFPGTLEHQRPVQGFNGMQVDHPDGEPFRRKHIRGLQAFLNHQTCGQNRYIRSLAQDNAFAQLEVVVWPLGNRVHRQPSQAEVACSAIARVA